MTITVNTKAYDQDSTGIDVVGYRGPAHTFSMKDYLQLKRVAPKSSSSFAGVSRVTAKFSRTVVLNSDPTKTAEAIVEVTTSLPVGMAEADIDSIRDDMGDFLLLQPADDLFLKQDLMA